MLKKSKWKKNRNKYLIKTNWGLNDKSKQEDFSKLIQYLNLLTIESDGFSYNKTNQNPKCRTEKELGSNNSYRRENEKKSILWPYLSH